ncbi:MAG TPA: NADH-quinone oxidoreductase subunit L [Saprospiraceae bacterium]|nr:NADH-quinone oxidoreductase subunit L [Saprospiraceae bacterium]
MGDFTYTIWIFVLPVAAFLITGLFGSRMPAKISGWIGTASISVVFLLALRTAYQYFFQVGFVDGKRPTIFAYKEVWMKFSDTLTFDMGILIDPISVMMLVVVATVSFMVHIYSIGYMKGDPGYYRFFAFLSLFSVAMLGLVVATNIFQIYFFWELVGLSSYLLIGFYYEKPSAVAAAKKAFIVTRFADLGFLIGILLLSYYAGTFDFMTLVSEDGPLLAQAAPPVFMGLSVFGIALSLIFIGGAGKSAMFPLHIWLPDAMEGPTPVSALIHAATMVVAGVYLVARLFPAYHGVDGGAVLHLVAWTGAISSLFAAIIAMTQDDIKRVLAFSTMSQIGYMMLALGVSGMEGHDGLGYMASMFHLFTHAMFKALLFLGAGSVIHAVHSNLMSKMGGLHKYMKITSWTFLIACLAISGIPPFSGFFSKDEILVAAFEKDKVLWAIEYIVAGITAFYMFRIYFGIFWGKKREYHHAPHESPLVMTVPLIILAGLTMVIGWALPFGDLMMPDRAAYHGHIEWSLAIPSILIGAVGIVTAYIFYFKETNLPDRVSGAFGQWYVWAKDKFYFDEIYQFFAHKIMFAGVAAPVAWFDRHIVDGFYNGLAWLTETFSYLLEGWQSGRVRQYAFTFVAGLLVILFAVLYLNGFMDFKG